jgi:organic radical activating enzyme
MDKIIFGAGEVGKALYNKCKELNIKIKGFCDNDLSKKVLPVEYALKLQAEFLIATGDVKIAGEQLKGKKILYEDTVNLLSGIDLTNYEKYTQWCILNCIDANRNWDNPFFLRSLDLIITERCSLKCKDCSNLMQYYKNPKDCSINQLLYDMNELLDKFKVGEFRVIGGEPFLNKYWESIVAMLEKNKRVNRIVIYTNGTILPSPQFLISPKVFVMITDYGKLSRKIKEIKELFDKHKVNYKIQTPIWTDCGGINKHNRTPEENKRLFKNCCSRNTTLSNGKLYACAFSANLARLGIYDSESSCDYCSGRGINDKRIEAAKQI